jgi:hypothetical protein
VLLPHNLREEMPQNRVKPEQKKKKVQHSTVLPLRKK